MRRYGAAFQCMKTGECPERNDEQGCPAWQEWPESFEVMDNAANRINTDERLVRDCVLPHLPRLTRMTMHRQDQVIELLQIYGKTMDDSLAAPRPLPRKKVQGAKYRFLTWLSST